MKYWISRKAFDAITDMLEAEEKIKAIKLTRQETGAGLRESKMFVELIAEDLITPLDFPLTIPQAHSGIVPPHEFHLLKWSREDLAQQLLLVAEMSIYLKESGQFITEENEDES